MKTSAPTGDELAESDEMFRAMCLIQRADDNRFGGLIKRLKASMDVGRNEYPTTVADAYDLLLRTANDVTSRNNNNSRNNRQNNTRVMFAQQRTSNDTTLAPGTDGRVIPQVDCWNCLQPGHTMHNCPEPVNAENRRKHGISAFMVGHLFSQNSGNMISSSWILIDTGSTVDVSNNPAHVTNIRPCLVDEKLKILTNGGSLNYDKMATLKLLQMDIHYNASSMATILSLASVDALDGVYITMDTREKKAIMVHVNGSILVFKMCFDGLFYFDTANRLAHTINDDKEAVIPYNFLQTVGGNKSFFTKREIKGANQAQREQEIIGWRSDTTYRTLVSDNLLKHSTVIPDDVQRAEYIYSTAAALSEGKMTRVTPPVVGKIEKVELPAPISKMHKDVELHVDFFFVNKIAFLHTKSATINFLTAQHCLNRTKETITDAILKVIKVYTCRGFNVTAVHGDGEFNINMLKDEIFSAKLVIYAKDQHVPIAERSIRTIKEWCRCACHAVPYTKYTKLMVKSLIESRIMWLNRFPSTNGLSTTLSPSTIVTGEPKPDMRKSRIPFGSYAMVYTSTSNDMKARSVPAIALVESNNLGGCYFM